MKRHVARLITLFAVCGCLLASACAACAAEPEKKADATKIDFAHDVLPILKARCASCHTDGKYEGSLSLDTREAILKAEVAIPGKSGESEIYRRITSKDPDERMPNKGDPLTADQIATLKNWIDAGLPWEEAFTFKRPVYAPPLKPRRVEPPQVAGMEHPIDRIVDGYFREHGAEWPAPLDDSAFVRRVYLDIIGLLPTPAELDAFLADTSTDKRDKLIDRLLADKTAYAEHWLTCWNDMLRNDYAGTGYIDGGRKQITTWLYRSLAENKPYDQFVRELIAPGDEAAGFINGIQWRGRVNASQRREVQFSQNISQVFFGANLKCASCHDSFIDDWKLADSYGLAAVIAEEPLEIHRCDKATGETASPKFLFPELGNIDVSKSKADRLRDLAALMTHADNGRFTRTIANRLWDRLIGRGIVYPVDMMANRPWSEDLLDYLAMYLVDHDYDLKQLIRHIATSRVYQSQSAPFDAEPSADEFVFRGPQLKRMSAEQFIDAIWMITGTAPAKAAQTIPERHFGDGVPEQRRFIRASLVNSDALMRSLGRPNREQVVTTRPDQLTTLQALDLSNGKILADTLSRGAENLLTQHSEATNDELAAIVWIQALCRRPTADEAAFARELIGERPSRDGIADLLWAVVMLPEFQLIR
jgi:hypothetical protein